MTAIKHWKDLMQEAPYNLLDTSQRAQKQLSCIHWTHVWSNLISYWTTALWWTWGDIRTGNLAPTDFSYGLKHLPLMSLQHSQWNQSGIMHSANALVWQITFPCHFHTSMPPGEIFTPCLPRHSSTPCQIVRDNSLLWMPPYGELNLFKFQYRCQFNKVTKKISLTKTNKWTKYYSLTCLQMWSIYWNHPENDNIEKNNGPSSMSW